MQLASYGAYGICFLLALILLIITSYVKGAGFTTQRVFYLLAVASFLSRESFALTNDGGGKKGRLFYLMILLVSLLALMTVAAILFGVYLLAGYLLLSIITI
jgi:hypothetical protein